MMSSIARRAFRSRLESPSRCRRRAARPTLERIEDRVVLSAFTPPIIQQAYGLGGAITFDHGTIPGDGRGQTIAIIDPLNDPNIVADASAFSQAYGLPQFNQGGPSLRVVTPSGAPPSTIASATPGANGLARETALDVEWAHAVAPQANILLVEVPVYVYPNGSYDAVPMFQAAYWTAQQPGVSVVSMSWGGSFTGETINDAEFTGGVTFVASAGDSGTFSYPASSTNVIGVGGTALTVDSSGQYVGETVWDGSGGGPDPNNPGKRGPDVGYNAVNYAYYDSWDSGPGTSGWAVGNGTSFGTPQWAGIIAIADQGRALEGLSRLTTSSTRNLLQSMSAQGADFHTSIPGSNLLGYSGSSVYGAGTPLANRVVAGLAQEVISQRTSLQIRPGVPYTGVVASFQDFTGEVVTGPNAGMVGINGGGGPPAEVLYLGNGQYVVYATLTLNTPGSYTIDAQIERYWLGWSTVNSAVAVSSMTPNQLDVQGLYEDFLHRPADPGGLGYWSSQLPYDANWTPGPQSPVAGSNLYGVASGIARSGEGLADVVSAFYWTFLKRAPDSGGLAAWTGQLAAGATEESVMSGILGSQEFLNDSGGSGGAYGLGSNYIMALYWDLLGRSFQQANLSSAEVTSWVNTLASLGGVGSPAARARVAYAFATSGEFRSDAVRAMYGDVSQYRPFQTFIPDLLERYLWSSGPSPAEVASWVNSGLDLLSMEIAIASSGEFYTVPHA